MSKNTSDKSGETAVPEARATAETPADGASETPGAVPQRADGAPWRNFYGRRHGKALRKGQVAHLERTLPHLQLPDIGWDENPERAPLDLRAIFGREAPRMLEIGFGGGEHLVALATRRAEVDLIGCEPFVNGVAMLLPRVAEAGLTNIRLHAGDARDLLDVLAPGALSRIYLLYPDPWPKTRHRRRRFVQPDTLVQMARALRAGGELRVATDIPDYVRHTQEAVRKVAPLFHPLTGEPGPGAAQGEVDHAAKDPAAGRPGATAAAASGMHRPWPHWHRTRYEAKAIREGRTPHYLRFRRTDTPAGD